MATLVKWAPFQDLDAIGRRMRRMLEDFGVGPEPLPAADVYETEKEVVVELEVPGFDDNELKLEVSDHTLTVKGERLAALDRDQGVGPHAPRRPAPAGAGRVQGVAVTGSSSRRNARNASCPIVCARRGDTARTLASSAAVRSGVPFSPHCPVTTRRCRSGRCATARSSCSTRSLSTMATAGSHPTQSAIKLPS